MGGAESRKSSIASDIDTTIEDISTCNNTDGEDFNGDIGLVGTLVDIVDHQSELKGITPYTHAWSYC